MLAQLHRKKKFVHVSNKKYWFRYPFFKICYVHIKNRFHTYLIFANNLNINRHGNTWKREEIKAGCESRTRAQRLASFASTFTAVNAGQREREIFQNLSLGPEIYLFLID